MARYEKTIAGNDYVFSVTIPVTGAVVYDLLTPSQQALISGQMAGDRFDVVDGYIVSYQGPFQVTRSHPGAGTETVLTNEKYLNPVENWPLKVIVFSSVPTPATVRVFVNF